MIIYGQNDNAIGTQNYNNYEFGTLQNKFKKGKNINSHSVC